MLNFKCTTYILKHNDHSYEIEFKDVNVYRLIYINDEAYDVLLYNSSLSEIFEKIKKHSKISLNSYFFTDFYKAEYRYYQYSIAQTRSNIICLRRNLENITEIIKNCKTIEDAIDYCNNDIKKIFNII